MIDLYASSCCKVCMLDIYFCLPLTIYRYIYSTLAGPRNNLHSSLVMIRHSCENRANYHPRCAMGSYHDSECCIQRSVIMGTMNK